MEFLHAKIVNPGQLFLHCVSFKNFQLFFLFSFYEFKDLSQVQANFFQKHHLHKAEPQLPATLPDYFQKNL